MAGTPSAAWFEKFRSATVEPVVHCSVALSGTTMDFHNYCHLGSLDSTVTGDPLLSEIASVSTQTDPTVRSTQMSELTLIVLDDNKIRSLAATQEFYDSIVTIRLGAPGLALSDFEVIFKGPITRVHPTPGNVLIKVANLGSLINEKSSKRTYYNKHPFEVIKQMLLDSGVDSGDIHTASFTPSTYSADISHYCFSTKYWLTAGEEGIRSDKHWDHEYHALTYDSSTNLILNYRDFVDEVLTLTRTSMFLDTDGKVKLKHFLASEAVVKHFTTSEYTDFSQLEEDIECYNIVNIDMVSAHGQGFTRKDNTSITNHGEHPYDIESHYLCPLSGRVAKQQPSGTPAVADQVLGFAGVRNLVQGVSGDESISSDRPAYWLHRAEIFKSTSPHTYADWYRGSSGTTYNREIDDDGNRLTDLIHGPIQLIMNGMATRPFAGNQSAIVQSPSHLWDVTVLYDFSQYVLDRFSNSAPQITFKTGLEYVYLEMGDFISIDSDLFLSTELGLNSLDSSVKFEITQKEITPLGGDAGIVFTCAYATKTSPPAVSIADQIGDMFDIMAPNFIQSAADMGFAQNSVLGEGFGLGTGSGLNGTVDLGAGVSGAGFGRQLPADTTFTAIANKDNYVGFSGATGEITVTVVDNGDPEPELRPNEIRLGKAVAGATSISSVTDLRNFGWVSVNQLDPLAVVPGLLNLWNNSFDIWPSTGETPPGWSYDQGDIVVDFQRSDTARVGRYSLKTLNTSTNVRLNSRKFPVDPNKSYDASVYLQTSAAFVLRADVYWYKADGTASSVTTSTSINNSNLPSTGAWHQKNTIVTPPSDAAYGKFTLFRAASPGGLGYFDDLKFREVPASFRTKTPATGAGTAVTKDTDTAVVFGAEIHDYGGNYNTTNGRFTAPENGVYEFTFTIQATCTGGVPSMVAGYLLKNGSNIAVALGAHQSASPYHASVTVQSGPIELSEGDYITTAVRIGNRDATLVTAVDDSYFAGRRVQ